MNGCLTVIILKVFLVKHFASEPSGEEEADEHTLETHEHGGDESVSKLRRDVNNHDNYTSE